MNHTIGGRFALGEFLAQGGMGAVYAGQDLSTGQPVAIKHLKPEIFRGDPSTLERFEREGAALRQLNHPNVVKMLAAIHEGNDHYLVMEYVGGGSLAQLIKTQGHLSVLQTLQIALDLTDALIRAHRLKILHRDIKPGNILLDTDGTPRLSDFGVARVGDSDITPNGMILGTGSYLPPESLNNEGLDPRSDIWSFGVTLFEMLSGITPFSGDTISAVVTAIMTKPVPDLEALCPDAPIALIDLIYRMLEKDRTHRIGSARQVGMELEAILNRLDSSVDAYRLSQSIEHADVPSKQPTPNNLLVQATPFVGREADLAQLGDLLHDPQTRLVTILGPGGMGKTRLALEAAQMQLANFPNGIFFVDLAPLTDQNFMVTKIAESIRFSFYRVEEPEPQLLDYLRQKKMLIIMDNFEHLMENTKIVTDMLEAAPDLKILTTSREKLSLQEEHILRIEGMELPNWNNLKEAKNASVVKLFLQSAIRVKPDFAITEENLSHLAYICRRVAGMPLGILLAASWVEMLSLQEIAQELAGGTDFLNSDIRDLPSRHRSMRAVFDYSWNLISEAEREVYKKLAIFRQGFKREAAQMVTGASLRTLTILVNKSLVRRDAAGRYEIHEMLRQYAEEKLNETPELRATVQEAHCRYYATFMKSCEAHIRGEKEIVVMPEIEQDFDNIRMAWEWAVDNGRELEIRQIIFSLDRFMGLRSLFRQKLDTFQQAASKLEQLEKNKPSPSPTPSLSLGIVLGFLSICYSDLGDNKTGLETSDRALAILRHYDAPRELAFTLLLRNWIVADLTEKVQLLEESLSIFKTIGVTTWMGSATWNLSMVSRWRGDYEKSAKFFDEAVAIGKKVGDRLVIAGQADFLGNQAIAQGNYGEARGHFEEALRMYRELNSPAGIAEALGTLAWVACWEGRYAEAEQGCKEALSTNRALGFRQGMSANTKDLAMIVYLQGRYAESQQLALDALELARRVNNALLVSSSLNYLGRASAALEQYAEAADYVRQSLVPSLGSQAISYILESLTVWADILSRQGNIERAIEIVSFAMHYPNVTMENRYFADSQYVSLKAAVAPDVFAAAEQNGKTLQLDALVNEFLSAVR